MVLLRVRDSISGYDKAYHTPKNLPVPPVISRWTLPAESLTWYTELKKEKGESQSSETAVSFCLFIRRRRVVAIASYLQRVPTGS